MLEAIFAAVCSANRSYLQHFLSRNPPERHAEMIASFERHMSAIARFCHDNYHGAGTLTTAFIRDLHRSLYPSGYREVQRTLEGNEVVTMVPGEYKTFTVRGERPSLSFTEPARVAKEMEALVGHLNATLVATGHVEERRKTIIFFGLDMVKIHPFPDANGRVSYMLVDLLLIQDGFSPINLCEIKERDKSSFLDALDHAWARRDLAALDSLVSTKDGVNSALSPEAHPYWNIRYMKFSRWDEGIQADYQGLYSAMPEIHALQLAASMPGKVVLDAFCGIGGCAIAFARSGKRVLAVEIDERRLEMARNNARVYGVENQISFIHGDVTKLIGSLHYDAAFFDPPRGGPGHQKIAGFSWDDLSPNPRQLLRTALARCEIVGLAVPANFNMDDLSLDQSRLEIHKAVVNQHVWHWNVFYRKAEVAICSSCHES